MLNKNKPINFKFISHQVLNPQEFCKYITSFLLVNRIVNKVRLWSKPNQNIFIDTLLNILSFVPLYGPVKLNFFLNMFFPLKKLNRFLSRTKKYYFLAEIPTICHYYKIVGGQACDLVVRLHNDASDTFTTFTINYVHCTCAFSGHYYSSLYFIQILFSFVQTLHPVFAIVLSKLFTFCPSLRIFNFNEFVKTVPGVLTARHQVKYFPRNLLILLILANIKTQRGILKIRIMTQFPQNISKTNIVLKEGKY